jgi:hypothetical protein
MMLRRGLVEEVMQFAAYRMSDIAANFCRETSYVGEISG